MLLLEWKGQLPVRICCDCCKQLVKCERLAG